MEIINNWRDIKLLFKKSFTSSFHFSIASVTEKGEPHVTPIGSLILGKPGKGIYFEKFTCNMPENFKNNSQLCVMAVNSSKWFWFKSLWKGKFGSPPAVRLYGVAGQLRKASDEEIRIWQKRVNRVRFTRGHALMWQDMCMVREIDFTRIETVNLGEMTRDLWCSNQVGLS